MAINRNPRTAFRRVKHELLIISSDKNNLTVLNDTAARVWELLENETTLEALAAALVAEFRVDSETARRDVAAFVEDLTKRGLVTVR